MQKDIIVQNELYRVMAVDALASSHPLSTPAEEINTPAQISEMFDSISYSKVLPGRRASPETAGARGGRWAPAGWGHRVLLAGHSFLSTPLPPQGASVLRMLSSFLTEDLFKKGLAVSALGQPLGGGVGAFLQPCPWSPSPACPGGVWGLQLSAHLGLFPQSYLQTYSYNSTTYLDLWDSLQKVGTSLPPSHSGGILRY